MSISAIATGKQNCKAEIKWLHQCYVLDAAGTAFCILEFIVEIKKGTLNYLDLYFPYSINKLRNRTLSLLDEKNKYFYTEGYKIISINPKNSKCGEIVLDGIKTGVKEVSLEHAPTNLGSKVTINFLKAIHSGEFRAIRMEFDCKNLSSELSEEKHSLTLTYYDFNAAKFLSLDKAVNVNHLFVWIVFPYGADSMSNITPPFFQQRTWDSIDLNRVETFYDSRTKSIWSCMPRTLGLWARHIENKEPALRTCSSIYLNCDYVIHKGKFREDSKEKETKGEKADYAIMWSMETESEGKELDEKEYNRKNKEKQSFLIIREAVQGGYLTRAYKNRKKMKPPRGKLTMGLLSYILKHKGNGGSAENLLRNVWPAEKNVSLDSLREDVKNAIKNVDKMKLKDSYDDIQQQESVVRRKLIDLNKFLRQFKVKVEANSLGEFEFTGKLDYLFIEKY